MPQLMFRSLPSMSSAYPVGARFAERSTSAKIFIILTLALLPLGLISSLASIEAARTNRANRVLAAHLIAGDSADRMTLLLDRAAATLIAARSGGGLGCRLVAATLHASGATNAGVALFDGAGRALCASRMHVVPRMLAVKPVGAASVLSLDPVNGAVRIITPSGAGWALAELPAALLARTSHPNALDGSYDLRLRDGGGRVLPLATMRTVSIGRDIVTTLPVVGGQLRLSMTVEAAPLSANELLVLLLPLVMWAAGAAIGWLVVDRLVLRPLADLQRAVDEYRLRGGRLAPPRSTSPAQEIRLLGEALAATTATIARHEHDLEEGLARQTRLTREVHHRVKNNLQVVASLLNIHARGARAPEAAAAYGAIQRRVDALALVHRSHHAEMEVNRGVALRPLIGELAASLRGSAPAGTRQPRILIDVALHSATQDVAVPVAFMITELVELAMLRVPGTTITITLGPRDDGGRAPLAVRSDGLRPDAAPNDAGFELGQRVIGGLARQLRATLAIDDHSGTVTLDIAIMAPDTASPSRDRTMQHQGGALPPRAVAS